MPSLHDRYRSCLLAGAVGDALGAAYDGQSAAEVRAHRRPESLSSSQRPLRYLPVGGDVGANTDATQMLLFTAEGLLRAHTRRRAAGHDDWPHDEALSSVHRAYLRWYDTQRADKPPPRPDGWLVAQRAMYQRRARDPVTPRILRSGLRGRLEAPINNARDASVLARAAPIAMASWTPWLLARDIAALTHTHADAAHATAAFAVVLQKVLVGRSLADGVESAWRLATDAGAAPLARRMEAALEAADQNPTTKMAEHQRAADDATGCLVLALYAVASTKSSTEAIEVAISTGGDASRAGIATGLLSGALHGAPLPEVLTGPLELADLAATVADDLYAHFSGTPFELTEAEWDRYPG